MGRELRSQEAGLASVGFFSNQNRDANKLGFVGEHLDERGMGNLHKLLMRFLPNST